jgi:hypothetical protein
VIPYEHALPNVLFAEASVLKAGGSPTAQLSADVTIVDPVLKQITVKCVIPNGTATDLGTNDMLVIYVHGAELDEVVDRLGDAGRRADRELHP